MISVSEALDHLFALVAPLPPEEVGLRQAAGRRLVHPVVAQRDQPPFDAASMDGYALKSIEAERHAQFKVVGEAAAGHAFSGTVGAGQAVRIFTGAPVPKGADTVVIQEDVSRTGDVIVLTSDAVSLGNIRPKGNDFARGDEFAPDHALTPRDIALLAAMNIAKVTVRRQPSVVIIPTGDELVQPGEIPRAEQIVASNTYGLAALLEAEGCRVRLLPIARDSAASLGEAFAASAGADLVVTIGGASVGDHDLVGDVAASHGMARAFYKIAMRPGKPLMAGQLDGRPLVGLPGNPVSAMVCGAIFLLPMLRVMQGVPPGPAPRQTGALSHDIAPNGPREHYMRARRTPEGTIRVFERQDSALLGLLAEADVLVVRPPHDPARHAGSAVEFILL